MPIISDLLRSNEEVRVAYAAMRKRGATDKEARTKIAQAIVGCLWEDLEGTSDRFGEVISALSQEQNAQTPFLERPSPKALHVVTTEYSTTREFAEHEPASLAREGAMSRMLVPHGICARDTRAVPEDRARSEERVTATAVLELHERLGGFIKH
jgi:hypothetical protein